MPLGLATYTEFNIWWNQLAVATLITLIPVLIFVGFAISMSEVESWLGQLKAKNSKYSLKRMI